MMFDVTLHGAGDVFCTENCQRTSNLKCIRIHGCIAYLFYIYTSHDDVASIVSLTGKVLADKFWMSAAKPETLSLTNSYSSCRLPRLWRWSLKPGIVFRDNFFIYIYYLKVGTILLLRRSRRLLESIPMRGSQDFFFDLQENSAVRIQRPEDVGRITHYVCHNMISVAVVGLICCSY